MQVFRTRFNTKLLGEPQKPVPPSDGVGISNSLKETRKQFLDTEFVIRRSSRRKDDLISHAQGEFMQLRGKLTNNSARWAISRFILANVRSEVRL